jgi:hypothetical protein
VGRQISPEGISIPEEKMKAVKELPAPRNRKELLSVLGTLGWWKSWISCNIGDQVAINSFSSIVKEISLLNRSNKDFKWNDDAQASFDNAKRILASNKVFQLPDFTQPFVVVSDASNIAIGGALLQKFGDKQKLIAVYSKTLSTTEQNWSATEREGYALLTTVEKFSYYLEGKPFLCLTDHKALVALDRKLFSNYKLRRWQDRLSKYRFTVQYLRDQDNCLADLLSRP